MRIAVIGTGMVGRALAAKLAEVGHEVTVGTRGISATLARTEPDHVGTPPFAEWRDEHPAVALATMPDAAAGAELVVRGVLGQFGWQDDRIIDLGDITGARGAEMFARMYFTLVGALGTFDLNIAVLTGDGKEQ